MTFLFFSKCEMEKIHLHDYMLPVEEIEVNGISNDNHFAFKVFYTMVGVYIHVCESMSSLSLSLA